MMEVASRACFDGGVPSTKDVDLVRQNPNIGHFDRSSRGGGCAGCQNNARLGNKTPEAQILTSGTV
jgi:hypothetical protein